MKKMVVGCWLLVVGVLAAGVARAELVEFRDYDAQTGSFTNAVRECALVTGETRILEGGWWAVDDEVTIPTVTNLTVNGAAHLILCDGARLTASAVGMQPGVSVSPGNTLAIYGQTAGTGTLTAGGGRSQDGGTVTICGGVIVAQGGEGAAGIGGGRNYISGRPMSRTCGRSPTAR